MNANPAIVATLMQLPEAERLEIVMTVLDRSSPEGLDEAEILQEAALRHDELESGRVTDISFEDLVTGLEHLPQSRRE